MSEKCLQQTYAPNNACFGCGPANPSGLHVKSYVDGDKVIARWSPEKMHEAFPGVLNGGIIGALLDCHCNWTAAWHLMKQSGESHPPCTVTAYYNIKLLRPTPTEDELRLEASVFRAEADRATIHGTLSSNGKDCATCEGLFVAVKPGHPAYHRW